MIFQSSTNFLCRVSYPAKNRSLIWSSCKRLPRIGIRTSFIVCRIHCIDPQRYVEGIPVSFDRFYERDPWLEDRSEDSSPSRRSQQHRQLPDWYRDLKDTKYFAQCSIFTWTLTSCPSCQHENEFLRFRGVEGIDRFLAVHMSCIAIQSAVLILSPPTVILEQIQDSRELWKDQHTRA